MLDSQIRIISYIYKGASSLTKETSKQAQQEVVGSNPLQDSQAERI